MNISVVEGDDWLETLEAVDPAKHNGINVQIIDLEGQLIE
jgi:hypothetical protein